MMEEGLIGWLLNAIVDCLHSTSMVNERLTCLDGVVLLAVDGSMVVLLSASAAPLDWFPLVFMVLVLLGLLFWFL